MAGGADGARRTGGATATVRRAAARRAHPSTAASIAVSAPSIRRSLRSRSVGSNVRQLRLTSSANSLDDIIAPDSSRTRSLLRRGAEPCTATSRASSRLTAAGTPSARSDSRRSRPLCTSLDPAWRDADRMTSCALDARCCRRSRGSRSRPAHWPGRCNPSGRSRTRRRDRENCGPRAPASRSAGQTE